MKIYFIKMVLLDKYHKRKDALNNNITYTVHTNLPPGAAVRDGPEPLGEMYTWSLGTCGQGRNLVNTIGDTPFWVCSKRAAPSITVMLRGIK